MCVHVHVCGTLSIILNELHVVRTTEVTSTPSTVRHTSKCTVKANGSFTHVCPCVSMVVCTFGASDAHHFVWVGFPVHVGVIVVSRVFRQLGHRFHVPLQSNALAVARQSLHYLLNGRTCTHMHMCVCVRVRVCVHIL